MPFGNEDREYARPTALPDWLEEFAKKELKKEGNPFDDIRDLFQQKNDIKAVEERVQDLRERVGLDKIEKIAATKDDISGGLGDNQPDEKFDPEQLEKGIKVELEHTDDPDKAKEIVKDHLMESKDFKDEEGGEYYDELDEMEEDIKEKITKKKSMLARLITKANQLEEEGQVEAAQAVDYLISKLAESFAKDKKKDVFDSNPKLQKIIDDICISRAGFVEAPAIIQMLQGGPLKSKKMTDDDKEQLKEYIEKKIKETRHVDEEDDVSGMNYVVFVINEDDGNNDVFEDPNRI